jgi:hypothetical protein
MFDHFAYRQNLPENYYFRAIYIFTVEAALCDHICDEEKLITFFQMITIQNPSQIKKYSGSRLISSLWNRDKPIKFTE